MAFEGLVCKVGPEIGVEGLLVVEERWGLAPVKHYRAQKTQAGGRQRAAVDGDDRPSGNRIGGNGATIRVADYGNLELGAWGQGDSDPDQTIVQQQTVVSHVALLAAGTVGSIDGREQRVFALGLQKQLLHMGEIKTERLIGLVARSAGSPIGAQLLEERRALIDVSAGVVGGDVAGRIAKWLKVLNVRTCGEQTDSDT